MAPGEDHGPSPSVQRPQSILGMNADARRRPRTGPKSVPKGGLREVRELEESVARGLPKHRYDHEQPGDDGTKHQCWSFWHSLVASLPNEDSSVAIPAARMLLFR